MSVEKLRAVPSSVTGRAARIHVECVVQHRFRVYPSAEAGAQAHVLSRALSCYCRCNKRKSAVGKALCMQSVVVQSTRRRMRHLCLAEAEGLKLQVSQRYK